MARIEDLVEEVRDQRLRDELLREVKKLKQNKKFGLVFEEHLPETVRIPSLPLKAGELVTFKTEKHNTLWRVERLHTNQADLRREGGTEERNASKSELVVVRRFGEPIYPALIPVDQVSRGGNKPWHSARKSSPPEPPPI